MSILFVAALVPAGPAAADWVPKTLVGQTTSFSYQTTTSAAVGSDGTAVAAWLDEPTGAAFAAVLQGGVWRAKQRIYVLPANESVTEVRVAVAGDGSIVAATIASHFERNLAFDVVRVTTRGRADSAWSAPVELSPRVRGTGNVLVGADQAGELVVLWSSPASGTTGPSMKMSRRPVGGSWSAPVDVAAGVAFADFAMNQDGAAVAAWVVGAAPNSRVRAMSMLPDAGWLPPVDISAPELGAWNPEVAIDAQRQAVVVWSASDGSVRSSRQGRDGNWGVETTLSAPGVAAQDADVAVDDAGEVATAWSEYDPSTALYYIHARIQRADGAIAEQSWETTDAGWGIVGAPKVAFTADGILASVAWIDDGLATARATSWFAPTEAWSQPATLGPGLYQNRPTLAAGPFACAVWPTRGSLEFRIGFRAATYQPTYPVPRLASVGPSAIRAASAVSLTVSGSDFARAFSANSSAKVRWDGTDLPTQMEADGRLVSRLSPTETGVAGAHLVTVWNPGPGGGESQPLPVKVDGTPPSTSVVLSGKKGANGWFAGAVTASLAAQDDLSGTVSLTYALDLAAPVTHTFSAVPASAIRRASLAISVGGVHTLAFEASDAAGNVAGTSNASVPIDPTPPALTASVLPGPTIPSSGGLVTVVVAGSAGDAESGIDASSLRFDVFDEYGVVQPSGGIVPAGAAYQVGIPLLAERRADDADGRRYTIKVTVSNFAGLSKAKSLALTVR